MSAGSATSRGSSCSAAERVRGQGMPILGADQYRAECGLTILVNLTLLLFSGAGPNINTDQAR